MKPILLGITGTDKVKSAAKNILNNTKGKTSFAAIEEWLLSQGYVVIFYNTVVGDTEISRYHLEKTAENTKAFTYNSLAKVVFIDNTVSAEDKNYLLFHEAGHVALKHLNINRISTENKILLDIEADAVAYEIMHYKKPNTPLILFCVSLGVVLGVLIAAICRCI